MNRIPTPNSTNIDNQNDWDSAKTSKANGNPRLPIVNKSAATAIAVGSGQQRADERARSKHPQQQAISHRLWILTRHPAAYRINNWLCAGRQLIAGKDRHQRHERHGEERRYSDQAHQDHQRGIVPDVTQPLFEMSAHLGMMQMLRCRRQMHQQQPGDDGQKRHAIDEQTPR